jgi:ion channel-forming bestrophin family protein
MINYDPHRWTDHFFDIRGSMVREILGRVLACVIWSALVVLAFKNGIKVAIPSTLHSLIGLALGLLLVFRTNASYDRFWEGRKLWGGMVNETRNLIRMARAWIGDADAPLVKELALWTAAFPLASMQYLRGVKVELTGTISALPAARALDAERADHPVLAVASRMSECVAEAMRRGHISDVGRSAIDQNITLLVDYHGGCERIRKTPLPFAYVVHLRRALVLYCFTLPFALVDTFGWTTVLDVLAVAYIFFGIEEIGVEIEGPFGFDDNDLPLEAICETIKRNVFELGGLAVPQPPEKISGAL